MTFSSLCIIINDKISNSSGSREGRCCKVSGSDCQPHAPFAVQYSSYGTYHKFYIVEMSKDYHRMSRTLADYLTPFRKRTGSEFVLKARLGTVAFQNRLF